MGRYTYADYDIATKYVDEVYAHFEYNLQKTKSFIEMNYNRGNLTFNEYLAACDYMQDMECAITERSC